jgi:hypothetical protein
MTAHAYRERDELTMTQRLALLVSGVFVLVGILGFIPGITTNYGDMSFAGRDSGAELFGVFQVSILHNLVHLAFGLVGFVLARNSWRDARAFLVGGGVVYLVLWIYGLATSNDSSANFVPMNMADDWLHLILGIGMIALGLLPRSDAERSRARA